MRLPPLLLAVPVAGLLGGGAAVATAQDVPPFQPEPTTTTTTTEPAPAADPTAPTVRIALPRARRDGTRPARTRSISIALRDPESGVQYAQVDVKRRIRLDGRVRDQAYDGRRWWTTTSATKYRIFPRVGRTAQTHVLRLPKGLPRARYWIAVQAQNDPGRTRTVRVAFRTR